MKHKLCQPLPDIDEIMHRTAVTGVRLAYMDMQGRSEGINNLNKSDYDGEAK
jgi:hypothetical protein